MPLFNTHIWVQGKLYASAFQKFNLVICLQRVKMPTTPVWKSISNLSYSLTGWHGAQTALYLKQWQFLFYIFVQQIRLSICFRKNGGCAKKGTEEVGLFFLIYMLDRTKQVYCEGFSDPVCRSCNPHLTTDKAPACEKRDNSSSR